MIYHSATPQQPKRKRKKLEVPIIAVKPSPSSSSPEATHLSPSTNLYLRTVMYLGIQEGYVHTNIPNIPTSLYL